MARSLWGLTAAMISLTLANGCAPASPQLTSQGDTSTDTSDSADDGPETGGSELCPDGTLQAVILDTQSAVDAAEGCVRSKSDLRLGTCLPAVGCGDPADPVTSVATLHELEEVAGDLDLLSTTGWTTLEGLEALRFVGGSLRVGSQASSAGEFSGLEPLGALDHARQLEIYYAYYLTSLAGLEGLDKPALEAVTIEHAPLIESIGVLAGVTNGRITLRDMESLESLAGLESLVGPSLVVEGAGIKDAAASGALEGDLEAFGVVDCPALTSLFVSNEITSVVYLGLGPLPNVQTIEGMASLDHVGFLELSQLPALGHPLEFGALTSVGLARLWTGGVQSVRFPVLTTAENLEFEGPGIETLHFPMLGEVAESATIAPQHLSDLDLGALVHVGNDFAISGTSLTDLDGLAALESVDGNLEITDNTQLPTALAVAFAAGLDVGGNVVISGNAP